MFGLHDFNPNSILETTIVLYFQLNSVQRRCNSARLMLRSAHGEALNLTLYNGTINKVNRLDPTVSCQLFLEQHGIHEEKAAGVLEGAWSLCLPIPRKSCEGFLFSSSVLFFVAALETRQTLGTPTVLSGQR